jgi:hypothetical protein
LFCDSHHRHPEWRVGENKMPGLTVPTVRLRRFGPESHMERVASLLVAPSVAAQWLTGG